MSSSAFVRPTSVSTTKCFVRYSCQSPALGSVHLGASAASAAGQARASTTARGSEARMLPIYP
jgi:hypothetical protein